MTIEKAIEMLELNADEHKQLAEWLTELKHLKEQQSSDDCISRQAVLEAFWKLDIEIRPDAINSITDMIKSMPPVTAQPKIAHWIIINDKVHGYDIAGQKTWYMQIKCSECGRIKNVIEGRTRRYYYCPKCGAKMVEPQESEENEK